MSAETSIIDRLARLLRDEIAAIGAGRLETVRDLYAEKSALLAELEAASGGIEAGLAKKDEAADLLREQLAELQVLIRKDHALLERMAAATGSVARELARIRDRHGLGGLYESSGARRESDVSNGPQVDQSI
ncbi:hypothetical protein E0K89_013410 [Aquicoccus sp. SCR17]|nr:hypothetical protein [Carideicomes alvinocaridis]